MAAGVRHAMGALPTGPTNISGRSVTSLHACYPTWRGAAERPALNRYERKAIAGRYPPDGVALPPLLRTQPASGRAFDVLISGPVNVDQSLGRAE